METWTGKALLVWHYGGRKVGEKCLTFNVEHPPRDDEEGRMGATLRTLCADIRVRYGAPPRRVQVWVDGENSLYPVAAIWRADAAAFCYSTGIVKVQSPPSGARLLDLRESSDEPKGKEWR